MSHVKFVSPEVLEPASEWVRIGQGHFGDVFKVKRKDLHLYVAVKQLKDPSYRLEELLDEAEKIEHASDNYYVIQLHGIVKVPPCIIMQLMEYGCLGKLMERVKEIPWPFKYRILHEVALGMNWLHSLSLLHLDLKPGNVLLNDALHIRLADFGLSRFTSSPTALGDIEAVGGTLAYMPPEAFQDGYKPSESTDIYSFAILSFVVLKGDDPYPVHNSSMIRMSISEGQRPSFESLENNSSVKNLDKAIGFTKCCWDRDKQKRPSFGECCNQWDLFKSAYSEKEIKDAVKAVLNMMDCTDFPAYIPDVQQSASVPNTEDMSDMINKMRTIHIAEPPSTKQEAVCSTDSSYLRNPVQRLPPPPPNQPRTNVINNGPGTPRYRTGAEPVRNPQHIQGQQGRPPQPSQVYQPEKAAVRGQSQLQYRGRDPRSNPSFQGNVRSPQTVQSRYMQVNSRQAYQPTAPHNFPPDVFQTPFFRQGLQSWQPSRTPNLFPPNYPFPPQAPIGNVVNITLNNNMGQSQIGNNNEMYIGATRPNQNRFDKPMTHHSGWTRPPSGPTPPQISNIQISDNTGPLQVGDNNRMHIGQSNQYQGSNNNPTSPHHVHSAHSSSFVPANTEQSPQPTHPSQVTLPEKAGEALSNVGQPSQETARQTDQPLERPTIQDITVSSTLEGKENDNMNSISSL